MHKYLHHIGDFLADTSNLNDHQLATYLRMIWAYYKTELPLPNDCEGIAFAMRSDEVTVRLLLKNYFKLQGECWHQKRVDEEISAYRAKSESGKKSANARWNNANALQPHSEGNANERVFDANHKASNHKPIKNQKEKRAVSKKGLLTLSDWMSQNPEPDYSAVYTYAEKIGLPPAFLDVAFFEFAETFSDGGTNAGKKYADWKLVVLRYLRGNWLKLWYQDESSKEWRLNTAGIQAQAAMLASAVQS